MNPSLVLGAPTLMDLSLPDGLNTIRQGTPLAL